jgi:xanthine dehydrogenase large subunit
VADALGLPMTAVRVEVRRMGGGFGGKESQANQLAIACAVAAELTGRPCRMRYDRDDDMVLTGKRHDFRVGYEVGFDERGRILALDVTHWARCGWSMDLSLAVTDRAMLHADNAYWLPHVRITSHRLRTNTQSATAFRGFGGPQGMLGMERIVAHVAHALGLDPVEVRRANYYAPGQSTPYGMEVTDFVLGQMTDALLASCDYGGRRAAIAEWNARNAVLKRGIAFSPVKFGISFTLTHLNQAGALVHVYRDGSVAVNHGGTEMGQGLHRKVTQVAASTLGVPLARVRISATDTSKVPNTSATAASVGRGPQRHGRAGRLRGAAGPHGGAPRRAAAGEARGGGVPGRARDGGRGDAHVGRGRRRPATSGACRCRPRASTRRRTSNGTGSGARGGRSSTSPTAAP